MARLAKSTARVAAGKRWRLDPSIAVAKAAIPSGIWPLDCAGNGAGMDKHAFHRMERLERLEMIFCAMIGDVAKRTPEMCRSVCPMA